MLPKAILLDLDDTIVSFSAGADPCWQSVCQTFDGRLLDVTAADLFAAIKECRGWYWRDVVRNERGRSELKMARRKIVLEAFSRLGIEDAILARELADAYSQEREHESTVWLLPGAVETLRRFRSQGILMALITNGAAESQWRKIRRFALEAYFDCIVVEGDFGTGKPDWRVFGYVLEQLGVDAAEAWMVGDSLEWDVRGAQGVGIFAVWIDASGKGVPAASGVKPDLVVQSLAELGERLATG